MKKIFTLFAGLLLAVAVFAADRRPVVTVNSAKNYKIVIDGKTYFDNDMSLRLGNLSYGRHSIKVFEINRRGFFSREKLVASTTFKLDRDDLMIKIDRFGQIMIREKNDRRHGGFDDDQYGRDGRYGRDDRDWNDRNNRF